MRIVREAELLGAELEAYHTRENLIIGAKFLRDDLPYFVELLSEVATQTKYQTHTYKEQVVPLLQASHKRFLADTKAMALSSAHGVAFHRGLGTALHPSSSVPISKYVDAGNVELFSQIAYRKSNFAIVANGAEHQDVSKWVNEFFKDAPTSLPTGVSELESTQSKYYGGEERIAHASGNTMVIGFSGSGSTTGSFYKPEISVLAALLGGQSSIKWSSGFSLLSKASAGLPGLSANTKSAIYSDAGLLYVVLDGPARSVASAATNVVKAINDIASGKVGSEEIKKAKALAKFKELEFGQNIRAGLELTGAGLVHGNKAYQIDETGKAVDGVTEEQVKSVSKLALLWCYLVLMFFTDRKGFTGAEGIRFRRW